MKHVKTPLNNPFSDNFAHEEVTAPITGIHAAKPKPCNFLNTKIKQES